jgi:cell division protein FtsI/penicillin-binding protein 2
VAATVEEPVLDPSLSAPLTDLLEHVLQNEWYVDEAQVPGYVVGGKTGTAQVWDAEHNRWFLNLYNFSCVGFIGRQDGRPDLIVSVKIGEAPPHRNALGQFILPVSSTELFRRVATDAITTQGLLPVLPPADANMARVER